jgi:hypothetical protein
MTMIKLNGLAAADARIANLRKKIGWICHSVRIAALAYAIWVIYALTAYWSDAAAINDSYGRLLRRDLSEIAPWQQATAFGVNFAIWLVAAVACYSAWRLFSIYLEGKIFTVDAAIWLERLALYGAISEGLGIVTRPLISVILTLHFPADQQQRSVSVFIQPDDLAIMLLLFGLLALAHIQKVAAEIAGENAQFV